MSKRLRLVLLSFLMLFVELSLIRWLGSDVFYLSYFSNFVLLGSFLGIGIGFLRASSRFQLFSYAPVALAALVGFVLRFPVQVDRSGSDLIFFGGSLTPSGLPSWLILPLIFLAVALVMSMIAEGVARTFTSFEPLEAYRLDIMGSLLGIITFSLLSLLSAPPLGWGLVVAAVFLVLLLPRPPVPAVAALVLLVGFLLFESLRANLLWSPYYKIRLDNISYGPGDPVVILSVNGVPHQSIETLAGRRTREPIYFRPYALAQNNHADVLIVGAGNGTDTAIALDAGAQHVDAVEIDPRIYAIGRRLNPNKPYSDPRVTVHITDARAFMEQNHQKYELVLFALPDSITLIPGQSALRLESYLFTAEAMQTARGHLKPEGVFAQYNYYRDQWLLDRYGTMLQNTYGHPPCVESIGSGGSRFALLAESNNPAAIRCTTSWTATAAFAKDAVTDNHPFPYLRYPEIPPNYLQTLALVLIASLIAVRLTTGSLRQMSSYADLFAMGAAFLLLETKNVVQFALLFGTTWTVNALVFGGILLAVLAAVEVTRRARVPRMEVLYVFLFAALAVAWLVPPETLLKLDLVPRFLAAIAVAFGPIFIANLIFADRYKQVGSSTIAFGANLLGAMVGGVLEYTSLVVGYRSLLLVVAALYVAALVLERRQRTGAAGGAAAAGLT
jgi:spermidine synthase